MVSKRYSVAHKVTVIMPTYNLEDIIQTSIARVKQVLEGIGLSYEIIVVDDGSRDKTYWRAAELANGGTIKVLRNGVNMGKGYTVKKGVLHATGDYIVLFDADMEISPRQIRYYVKALEDCDVVLASKRHQLSRYQAPLMRKILSSAFNVLVKLLVGLRVSDTQTGLKAFRIEALKKIIGFVLVERYAYDVEVLILANLLKLRIVEMPIEIRQGRYFKLKDVLYILLDVLRITYRLKVTKWYQKNLVATK